MQCIASATTEVQHDWKRALSRDEGSISVGVTLGATEKYRVGQLYTANCYVNVVIKAHGKKWW